MENEIIRTLTIAGLDASGGAGMIADISTFEDYGTYGQVVLTTVVTMDPKTWNHQVQEMPLDLLKAQIDTVLTSDVPIRAMKTGMLGTKEIVNLAKETIERAQVEKVVIDPVLVCKGTDEVLNPDTAEALRDQLLPLAYVATPNLFEAGQMADGKTPKTMAEVEAAAKIIYQRGVKHVVVKGGRSLDPDQALDLYYDGQTMDWLSLPKIQDPCTHGAGCTFAAAITAGLAKGIETREAIRLAKEYVYSAVKHGFAYNRFVSPVYRPAFRNL